MLPVGAIIVGVIGLLLGGYAAITVSKINKTVGEHDTKFAKVDAVEETANQAVNTAKNAAKDLQVLAKSTQSGFDQIGPLLVSLQGSVTKLEESAKKPAPAAPTKKGGEPAVAGPGEYIVKPGDSGTKIAVANGVSLGDLQSVNPGVNWNGLKVGQKLKLPKK